MTKLFLCFTTYFVESVEMGKFEKTILMEDKDKDCLNPDNNSKYCFLKVANVFLLLANLLLIIIGFHYLPTCLEPDSSYFSVIVAVLSILVTVLLGWQIYNAVEMQNVIKKYDDLKSGFIKSNEQLQLQDQRNITLIDAFAKYNVAEKESNSITTKYRAFLEAYLLFLKANIPIGSEYINNCRGGFHGALADLENEAHPLDKQLLINNKSSYEDMYDKIRDTIKERQENLKALLKELDDLRDRRRDLTRKFEKELQQIQNPII